MSNAINEITIYWILKVCQIPYYFLLFFRYRKGLRGLVIDTIFRDIIKNKTLHDR